MDREQLAAQWREDVVGLQKSLTLWRSGKMRMLENDVDKPLEHVELLERMIRNLELGLEALQPR